MANRDLVDVLGGAIFAAGSAFVAIYSLRYGLGTATRMGPGVFPMALGVLGTIVGVAIAIFGLLRSGMALGTVNWRALIFVIAGMVLFGLVIEAFGFAPAVAVAVIVSAFADPETRPIHLVLLAISAVIGAWLIFTVGLDMQTPILRRFW